MKGLIVYATCYGSTKTYADWIAEETGFPSVSYRDAADEDIRNADVVVLGSWVLAHRLFLRKWIAEKEAILQGKTLYVFSVSGAAPGDRELDGVFTGSMSDALLKHCTTYQFGGRRETRKMSGFHKMMMFVATTFIEKDKAKKAKMKKYVDNVDRKYTKQLIQDLLQTHMKGATK